MIKKKIISFSLIVTISLALFIIINIFSFFLIKIYKKKLPLPMIQGYGFELEKIIKDVYPDTNFSEILEIYKNTQDMKLEFENYTMFAETKNYKSKHVNISKDGYRLIKNQEPITTNKKKIFIFGSSPTFGYNLRDQDTIASHLQEALGNNYAVFNFGRAYYYTRQQFSLLINLVNDQKIIPEYVIFINNHANERGLTGPNTNETYKNIINKNSDLKVREAIPFIKIIQYFYNNPQKEEEEKLKRFEKISWEEDLDYFLRTNLLVKQFCDINKINFYSIYAPAYGYKYKFFDKDPLTRKNSNYDAKSLKLFKEIDNKFKNNEMPDFFYNFLEIVKTDERLYVDSAHYSSKMSKIISNNIYKIIENKR